MKLALHFGLASRPLFGFYHPPDPGRDRRMGVVLCSPIGTDQTRSERTYRHLAEALAANGFACLRFDPFGTGDSGGNLHVPGLARAWVDDVGIAIAEVRSRAQVGRVALVGLRLGATVAMAHAAESGDTAALVLWSPCVSGAAFVNEVSRLHKVYARIDPHVAAAPPPQADGVEALGMFLPQALVSDLSRIDLLEISRRPAPRTLFVDGGNVPRRDAIVSRLRDLGSACEVRSHPGHKFLLTVSHRSQLPADVIESIISWLSVNESEGAQAAERRAKPALALASSESERAQAPEWHAKAPSPAPPNREELVVFGADHPLFGIFTPGEAERDGRDPPPPILLTNSGSVSRSGPHRLYTRLARRWASLGFDVLRVDLSGIGDSPARPGTEENLTFPPSGMADLRCALDRWPRAIIAGLCSGGDYAFQLGAQDPRIVGALLLNPRTFCVLDLAAVEAGAGEAGEVPLAIARTDRASRDHAASAVPRTLEAMARRGVDTVLVVSTGDPGTSYVEAHAAAAMRSLSAVPGFRRIDMGGADHSFTPVTSQERLGDLLTEHLAKTWCSGPPASRGGLAALAYEKGPTMSRP
jgi:alpha-beta hydrolase superfamily lysophospholipase